MGITERAKDKLKDAAGGVRGAGGESSEGDEAHQAGEGFEPEEIRRKKKPKDDLPQPENFRRQD